MFHIFRQWIREAEYQQSGTKFFSILTSTIKILFDCVQKICEKRNPINLTRNNFNRQCLSNSFVTQTQDKFVSKFVIVKRTIIKDIYLQRFQLDPRRCKKEERLLFYSKRSISPDIESRKVVSKLSAIISNVIDRTWFNSKLGESSRWKKGNLNYSSWGTSDANAVFEIPRPPVDFNLRIPHPIGDENIDPPGEIRPGECVQLPFYTCLLVTVANSEKWDKCYGYEIVSKIFSSRILIIITNLLGKIENTFDISENLQDDLNVW